MQHHLGSDLAKSWCYGPLQAICEVILRRRKEGVRDRRGTRRDLGDHACEINGSSAAGSVESEDFPTLRVMSIEQCQNSERTAPHRVSSTIWKLNVFLFSTTETPNVPHSRAVCACHGSRQPVEQRGHRRSACHIMLGQRSSISPNLCSRESFVSSWS
jgi:hypothetical protein